MASFRLAVERTLGFEGGFSDNPNDSGGRTKFGISEKWFPEAWALREPNEAEAKNIYRLNFWAPLRCDKLDSQNIANELFDTAVNIGLHEAVKILQQSLNALGFGMKQLIIDGRMGPHTLTNANGKIFMKQEHEKALFNFMNFLQAQHYVDIGSTEFLRGWFAHRIGGWVDYE